jgi:hypothetical protein
VVAPLANCHLLSVNYAPAPTRLRNVKTYLPLVKTQTLPLSRKKFSVVAKKKSLFKQKVLASKGLSGYFWRREKALPNHQPTNQTTP